MASFTHTCMMYLIPCKCKVYAKFGWDWAYRYACEKFVWVLYSGAYEF